MCGIHTCVTIFYELLVLKDNLQYYDYVIDMTYYKLIHKIYSGYNAS